MRLTSSGPMFYLPANVVPMGGQLKVNHRGKTMQDEQPGDREAAGAIEGMQETYGAPPAEPVTEGIPLDLLVVDPTELETE